MVKGDGIGLARRFAGLGGCVQEKCGVRIRSRAGQVHLGSDLGRVVANYSQ
jgi:hypothetical protein